MAASDTSLTIIIVFVFIALYLFNLIIVGMKRIKDNWPVYRCQPLVIPFASLFGHNTSTNFAYCIQNIQTNFMDDLLKPITFDMGILGDITSGLTDDLNQFRGFMDMFRFNLTDIFQNIFATMFNVMVEVQRLIINIKDMIGKLTGILITTLYILNGSMLTMSSAWNGPPGKLVRMLCFHPETQLNLQNGESVAMKDIALNSVLPNGARVCAVMQISNLDENGGMVEKMYKVKRTRSAKGAASLANDIIVSGSHLIYDSAVQQFVHVKELPVAELADVDCPVLYCLITSDHTIQIGDWIFHDWEDNNGSESKKIGI
jgi:hypothetical protein